MNNLLLIVGPILLHQWTKLDLTALVAWSSSLLQRSYWSCDRIPPGKFLKLDLTTFSPIDLMNAVKTANDVCFYDWNDNFTLASSTPLYVILLIEFSFHRAATVLFQHLKNSIFFLEEKKILIGLDVEQPRCLAGPLGSSCEPPQLGSRSQRYDLKNNKIS
jgi:hypothetical protein